MVDVETDVVETQEITNQDNDQDDQDKAVASLLASVGFVQDEAPVIEEKEAAAAVETEDKTEAIEKEAPEDKHERRSWQKLARRLKKEQAELAERQKKFEDQLIKSKEDPVAYLQEMGITVSEWADRQLSKLDTKENKALITRIAKLEEKELESQKKLQEQQEQQEQQYKEQLTNVVKQEFNNVKEKYTHVNVLITEGILNNTFFESLADSIQTEYEDTGIKPDLHAAFEVQEAELRKLYKALSKAYNQTGDRPGTEKTISQAPLTLSKATNQVSTANNAAKNPEEIKAEIMSKYGIGKSYGMV
jgi:hypothetical protein